ncbi:hypothetical protein DJ568_09085 [Mucilaginibacter hurinus]|uniref:Uncharacterized protein n=1 Tax=Mucilaginibacter hurinus TaxID=2201324 RepID=A0A367GPB7_9SPHI|nr:hypothetical protein DJ568_09085 [Mucilaginibacter hurinus]
MAAKYRRLIVNAFADSLYNNWLLKQVYGQKDKLIYRKYVNKLCIAAIEDEYVNRILIMAGKSC